MDISNIQENHFNNYYRNHKETEDAIFYQKIYVFLNRYLSKKETNLRVLDIGAGRGQLLNMLSNKYEKHAIEISEESIKIMEKNNIICRKHDISKNKLPYEDNYFNIVIATEVIEHIWNPEFVLEEAYRILKDNGLFICSVPNIYQISTIILYLFDIPPINCARYKSIHLRDFTKKLFKKALTENKFKILLMKGDIIFPFKCWFSRLMAGLFPRFSQRIIAFCIKI